MAYDKFLVLVATAVLVAELPFPLTLTLIFLMMMTLEQLQHLCGQFVRVEMKYVIDQTARVDQGLPVKE